MKKEICTAAFHVTKELFYITVQPRGGWEWLHRLAGWFYDRSSLTERPGVRTAGWL